MDEPPPRIRPGRAADAAAMAALCTELGYPSSEAQVRARLLRLEDVDHGLFVAEGAGGDLAGVIAVHTRLLLEDDPFAELTVLVVTQDARGEGIGSALVAEAAGWARTRGLRRVWVRVNVAREATHRFYESLGFRLYKQQRIYELAL
ncbi:MAG TPA: GNAT family N-acetyltransferase [Thermoleophilia bacterium]|nr:GNAT family N-acetyltransferase [Thermoleophilia bacterium]